MKRKSFALASFLAVAWTLVLPPAFALQDQQLTAIQRSLASAPMLELAPTTADIVRKATPKEQEEVAVAAVRFAVAGRANIVLSVVAAVSIC